MSTTAVSDAFAQDAISAMLAGPYNVALLRGGGYGAHTLQFSEVLLHEVRGAGYTPMGQPLKNARLETRDGMACMAFDNAIWPDADIVADAAVIYRPTTGRIACVLAFGATHAAVGGETFVLPIDCPIRL